MVRQCERCPLTPALSADESGERELELVHASMNRGVRGRCLSPLRQSGLRKSENNLRADGVRAQRA